MPVTPLRVIICSDVGNEADDQFAIVQALLTKRFQIKGLIAGFYNEKGSVEKAYDKMQQIVQLVKPGQKIPIVKGAAKPGLEEDVGAGAELIIREAHQKSLLPLFVVCLGGLTDLARAIKIDPQIASSLTAIWVGGGRYPKGSSEANLSRDKEAANFVMKSDLDLWQIPSNTYKEMRVSIAFLDWQLSKNGSIGEFLLNELHDFITYYREQKSWINDEVWILGDSTAIGVLLDEQKGSYHYQIPPYFRTDDTYDLTVNQNHKEIRIYDKIDRDLILMDLLAKIKD